MAITSATQSLCFIAASNGSWLVFQAFGAKRLQRDLWTFCQKRRNSDFEIEIQIPKHDFLHVLFNNGI